MQGGPRPLQTPQAAWHHVFIHQAKHLPAMAIWSHVCPPDSAPGGGRSTHALVSSVHRLHVTAQ